MCIGKIKRRETKEIRKNKACVNSLSKQVLVFATFEYMKKFCVLAPYQDVFYALKDIKLVYLIAVQTSLYCLQSYLI